MLKHTVTTKAAPGGTDHVRVYEGFDDADTQEEHDGLAVALFDGDMDIYVIETKSDLAQVRSEITRYYTDDYDRGPSSITFYSRITG